MSELRNLGECREPDIRWSTSTWELGLKYCYLSKKSRNPRVGHSFVADGLISATIWDFSNNTAE